jgi:DNA topoisomerase VI subunit A
VNSTETAQVERENLQIWLDEEGSVMSHLKVMARLKIDEEEGSVVNNTEVYLKARTTNVSDISIYTERERE